MNQNHQDQELLCACNGLKCDGICREEHLNRPRFTNPKSTKKDTLVRKQWAEKCPETYIKDQKTEHYGA